MGLTDDARRHDLDALRVIATALVFLFHCARFFGGGPWHLSDAGEHVVAHLFIAWLDLWLMPLFFLLAGAGSWFALRRRSVGGYLRDRVLRLLIPLYGIGICLVVLPQFYFELASNHGYEGSFGGAVRRHFLGLVTHWPDFRSPLFLHVFPGHLWFLHVLFLVCLLTLPALVWLRTDRGRRLVDRLATLGGRWGGAFLVLVPLVAVRVAFTHLCPGHHTWARLLVYAVYFLAGALVAADRRFTEGIRKVRWPCLGLGIAGVAVELWFILGLKYNYFSVYDPGPEPFGLMYLAFSAVVCTASWSWLVFVVGMVAARCRSPSPWLAWGNEAALPFYVLHQTVILCVGWYVLQWRVGMAVKYFAIAAISLPLILVIYELGIRRWNPVRVLFGMRQRRRTTKLSQDTEGRKSTISGRGN